MEKNIFWLENDQLKEIASSFREKVEEGLKHEILGVNDLQDINLLDEYRDIFIKSQKSVYENESVNDINCTD